MFGYYQVLELIQGMAIVGLIACTGLTSALIAQHVAEDPELMTKLRSARSSTRAWARTWVRAATYVLLDIQGAPALIVFTARFRHLPTNSQQVTLLTSAEESALFDTAERQALRRLPVRGGGEHRLSRGGVTVRQILDQIRMEAVVR
jgi:hypothetical protein